MISRPSYEGGRWCETGLGMLFFLLRLRRVGRYHQGTPVVADRTRREMGTRGVRALRWPVGMASRDEYEGVRVGGAATTGLDDGRKWNWRSVRFLSLESRLPGKESSGRLGRCRTPKTSERPQAMRRLRGCETLCFWELPDKEEMRKFGNA